MAKEKTRGQKQILEENKSTINFYLLMSTISMALYLLLMMFVFNESFTLLNQILSCLSGLVFGSCLATMKFMARPVFSSSGSLLDGGLDLNMKDGFSEHLKDLVILTTLTQILSIVSNYFWFLWLFAPSRGMYLLWVNFIGPWIFAPPPEIDEGAQEREDKKQRKLDRRMRRVQ